MKRMKKFAIYIVLLIAFALLSEFLIAVGLNSTYKEMEQKGSKIEQIEIIQAEATKVNGRIRGIIKNSEENPIKQKYVKVDFYSERDVYMGTRYIEIDKEKEEQPLELLFKVNNAKKYEMTLVDSNEMKETEIKIEILPKEMTRKEVIFTTAFAILLFM